MEPDFESTPEARSSRAAMRSITGSQVLARPSEWLELLRRYGNVAPFFSAVRCSRDLAWRSSDAEKNSMNECRCCKMPSSVTSVSENYPSLRTHRLFDWYAILFFFGESGLISMRV